MKISAITIVFLVISFAKGMEIEDSFWKEKFRELETFEQVQQEKRKFESLRQREQQLRAVVNNELYEELKKELRCDETLDHDLEVLDHNLLKNQQLPPQKKRKKNVSEEKVTRTHVVKTVQEQCKAIKKQKQFKDEELPQLIENFCATLAKNPKMKIVQLPPCFKYRAV